MPHTQRFVEVAAPLETRVSDGVLARLREALTFGAKVHERLNQTAHDEDLKERATVSAVDALKPGSPTFVLLVLLGLAVAARWWAVRAETRRILREHGAPSCGIKAKEA